MSGESIGALERGVRRAPYRSTVDLIARALDLSPAEHEALEAAAAAARVRARERTAPPSANNLPADPSPFIGRGEDLAALIALLSEHRLVTVTGSGGVGKTRAAIEAGRRFAVERDTEVWFVDLSPLADGALIADRIAESFRPSRRALLILDNCEHLIAEAAIAANELLQAEAGLSILATSRERLNVLGEVLYRLPSLSVPSGLTHTLAEARSYSAVELFIERARSSGFDAALSDEATDSLVDICGRLGGIPLALELAGARLPLVGLEGMRARLIESLSVSVQPRDRPSRQQTMQATIAWSYDLLDELERVLLRRLAVFSGGFTLAAAESVCADPLLEAPAIWPVLSSLVDKSLVTVAHAASGTRYGLLESVRSFAHAQLAAAGESESVARLHAHWIERLADSVRPAGGIEELSKANEMAIELDNVRAALNWCKRARLPSERGLSAKIVLGFCGLWSTAGRNTELESIAREALATIDEDEQPVDAALLLGIVISRCWAQPDGRDYIARAIPLYERLGHRFRNAQFYSMLTLVYAMLGDLEAADHASDKAVTLMLEDSLQESTLYADLLANRSTLRTRQGRFDDARTDLAASAEILMRLGNTFLVAAICRPKRAEVELKAGNYREALAIAQEMLASEEASAHLMIRTEALGFIACLKLHLGEVEDAADAAREQLRLAPGDETMAIEYLATAAALQQRAEPAARLMGFVSALVARLPLLGLTHRRTDQLLAASLREQLSADAIAAQAAIGASYTLAQATSAALAAGMPGTKRS